MKTDIDPIKTIKWMVIELQIISEPYIRWIKRLIHLTFYKEFGSSDVISHCDHEWTNHSPSHHCRVVILGSRTECDFLFFKENYEKIHEDSFFYNHPESNRPFLVTRVWACVEYKPNLKPTHFHPCEKLRASFKKLL